MKQRLQHEGVDPLVIPNGLSPDAYASPERDVADAFRARVRGRTVLVKMARFDPSKGWLASVQILAELKRLGFRPLLIARGGSEAHGDEVRRAIACADLRLGQRELARPGAAGLLDALDDLRGIDVLELRTHVDPEARRVLLRGAAVVLANSGHEPFGLVGLEAMAVHGLACTGCSGEDYAVPGRNAIVLETEDPLEFVALYGALRDAPSRELRLRAAGRATAGDYAWSEVLSGVLLPRIELARRV
jgi:glycosyltransferase involved in cell wall biosynthesis